MPTSEPSLPGVGMNLQDADTVADLFRKAAEANRHTQNREGASVHLPREGKLLISGDLHDHGSNFFKIIKLAALHDSPTNHVIVHEVIHGDNRMGGRDMSIRTLARLAAWKVQHPHQVHILQSNHELAQYGGDGILKSGVDVVESFDDGIDYIYGDGAEAVREAMKAFIRSYTLAVRCANGLFVSHSLPSPTMMSKFDPDVVDREPTDADYQYRGNVYMLVWGRNQTPDLVDQLAEKWNVRQFVTGHQPAEMGYDIYGPKLMVIASDHEHGHVIPVDLSKRYDQAKLIEDLLPLASVTG